MTPRRLRPGFPELWALAVTLFYAWSSVMLFRHHESGIDLAIFDQALRNFAHGHAPVSTIKSPGMNIWGDHFHPAISVWAPLYWIWDSPAVLLVGQAVLIGLGVWLVGRYACRRLPERGWVVAVAFAVSIGVQAAVAFDVHEVAVGVPIMALACIWFCEERYVASALAFCALMPVKEDCSFYLVGAGIAFWLRGRRALGAAVAGFGVAWTLVVTKLVIPALSPIGRYYYRYGDGTSPVLPQAAGALFHSLLWPAAGTATVLVLLAGVGFVAVRHPLAWVALPPLAVRLATPYDKYWGLRHHYNLLVEVALFVALIGVLPRLSLERRRLVTLVVALVAAVSFAGGHVQVALRGSPPADRIAAAEAAVAQVPAGARVAADEYVAPQLTHRADVSRLRPPDFVDDMGKPIDVDWVIADGDTRTYGGGWVPAYLATLQQRGWRVVYERDGYVVATRARG